MGIAIEQARPDDADAVCRLTERNGLPLDGVPASARASVEFVSACPSSATVMRKTL